MTSAQQPLVASASSFKRDTVWYGVAILADRGVGLLSLPLLTRSLSRDDFAAWNQVFTFYAFLSTALLMGFYHTTSSLVAGRAPAEARAIYVGVLRLVLVSSAVLLLLCFGFPDALSVIVFADRRYGAEVSALGVYAVSECFYELVVMAFLRSKGEIGRGSLVHVAKVSARLLIIWIGSQLNRPLIAMLLALTATNALIVLLTLRSRILPPSTGKNTLRFPRVYWSASLWRAWTVALTVFLAWASVAGNRFVVIHLLGLDSLAVYAANYSLLSITSFVPMILTFTLLHRLSESVQSGDTASARQLVDKSVGAYLFLTLPIFVFLVLFYGPLVDLLARGYVADAVLRTSLVCFFFLFGLEQVLVFATFSGANGGDALGPRVVSLVINVAVGYLLVSTRGVQYAAVSLCFGSAVVVVMSWVIMRRRTGTSGSWHVYGHIVLCTLCVAAIGAALIAVEPQLRLSQVIVASAALGILYLGLESVQRQSFTRMLARDSIGQLGLLRTRIMRELNRPE